MALKSANQTIRWLQRISTWVAVAIWNIAEVLESLLDFKSEDELREKGIKTADFVIRRGMYFVMDYGLSALSLAIGVTTKAFGFSLLEMFSALWVFDFLAAGLFVVIFEVTGKDLSLGKDFRRAVDTINGKSRIVGILTIIGIVFLAIVWTGPEKIITFFRKEIGTIKRVTTALIVLTAIQSFIWAVLYSFAYDFVTKL